MNILQDIKTAVNVFGEVRKARKNGASAVKVKPVYTVPVLHLSYWGSTMEGCLFYGQKWKPLRDVFDSFDEETQHVLTFAPKEQREWVDRAKFWEEALRPALEPMLYHEAMIIIDHWYIHCMRMRRPDRSGTSSKERDPPRCMS